MVPYLHTVRHHYIYINLYHETKFECRVKCNMTLQVPAVRRALQYGMCTVDVRTSTTPHEESNVIIDALPIFWFRVSLLMVWLVP